MFRAPDRAQFEYPRVLRYRLPVRLAGYFLILCSVYATALAAKAGYSRDNDTLIYQAVWAVLPLIPYFFVLRPMITARFQVFPDHIKIERKGKAEKIDFGDIVAVKSRIGFFSHSFYLVTKNGTHHRFTTSLERPEYIIESLVIFNKTLLSAQDYSSLREKLLLADHSAARFDDWVKGPFRVYTLASFGVLVALIAGSWLRIRGIAPDMTAPSRSWVVINVVTASVMAWSLIGAILYFFCDAVIRKNWMLRYLPQRKTKVRDVEWERFAFNRLILGLLVAGGAVAVILPQQDVFYRTTKFARSLSYRVDHRSSCLTCDHQIKTGDAVFYYNDQGNGRIGHVELPGPELMREPASDAHGIPKNAVIIREMNPDGSSQSVWVSRSKIEGRILGW